MRTATLTLSFMILFLSASSQNIRVSIYTGQKINSLTLNINQGKYYIKSGKETIGEYRKGDIFHITKFGNTMQVRDKKNFIGNFDNIEFTCSDGDGVFHVNPLNTNQEGRDFDDNLILHCNDDHIGMLNKIDMEKYIASVIEAEGGNNAPAEYYKAQAVLIRTYTIKNMFKHAEENFNLCNLVHCQAYKGRSSQNNSILDATIFTSGKVLVDKDTVLAMSPFHSNCGGVTSAAGMAWQTNLPYLLSVKDPFCLTTSNARWSTTISRDQWVSFVNGIQTGGNDYGKFNFSFNLPQRAKIVAINGIDLNLRAIREKFGLKSAFFSINDSIGAITFTGKGYGHGVGMCQQGAMEMARVGYTWLDIVHFYFRGVEITDYRELDLSRY